jgi:hypothetical protein
MFAGDGTVSSGWQQRGTWTVPAAVVTADSVMPASGTGSSQTFALQYSDTAGATDLATVWVFFTQTFGSGNVSSCMAYYNRAGNTLYLLNDAATVWMPAIIGTGGTLQNTQCAIAMGSTTAVPSGNTLTLNLAMTFKPAYAGAKNVYMFAGNGTASSGWQQRGTWTVP